MKDRSRERSFFLFVDFPRNPYQGVFRIVKTYDDLLML